MKFFYRGDLWQNRWLAATFAMLLGAGSVWGQAEIGEALLDEMLTHPERVSAYVVLADQVNANKVVATAAAKAPLSLAARGTLTITTLRTRHTATQAPIVDRLQSLGDIENIRGRWLVNIVGFEASAERIREIATWPEVAAVLYDSPWEVESATESLSASMVPGGRELGLGAIGAPEMWAMGYTGYGGIAFTADTGVDPFHQAINHKYAGSTISTTGWYDLDNGRPDPVDCDDHGTHVNGTILGLDRVTEDTIGVAFNAHWVGGAILCGLGTVDNIGAFEWALDPDGDMASTDDRPFVINNSWRDPSIVNVECSSANPYPLALDNLAAAGVAVVFSAGNSGPDPSTITPPHNYNSGLVNAFTIGALDGNNSAHLIADFSSRGPALCGRDSVELDTKPEVSAPGVRVRSCLPGGGYGLKSGTSMAAPHTSGALLLLHEAFPNLTGEELQLALYFSARDLGTAGEDNTYGRGIINLPDAYQYLIDQGNTPVPSRFPELAVAMTSIQAFGQQCDGNVEVALSFDNQGVVDVSSLDYELREGTTVLASGSVNVDLPVGSSVQEELALQTDIVGEARLSLVVVRANGEDLSPGLDLGGVFEVNISENEPANLVSSADLTALCLGSPIDLSFVSTTIADPTVAHFTTDPDNMFVPVTAGERFRVASLDEEVTLFGIPEYVTSPGPELPQQSDLVFQEADGAFMEILVTADIHIRTADIIAEETGRVLIQIEDEDGNSLGRVSETVEVGLNTLEFNTYLFAGETYRLSFRRAVSIGLDDSRRLRRSSIGDFIRVEDVDDLDEPNVRNSGFFLFNYKIGYSDGCPPQEIVLIPDVSRTASELNVTASNATTNRVGEPITFTETTLSSAGRSYNWLVAGLAQSDNTASVVFTPTEEGMLQARVAAVDDEGCQSGGELVVEVVEAVSDVEKPLLTDATLFPNPAQSLVQLRSAQRFDVERAVLRSMTGAEVRTYTGSATEYSVADVPAGTYTFEVYGAAGLLHRDRLVIVAE